jgi:hypothetical protein
VCRQCDGYIEVIQSLEEINAKLEEDNKGLERDLRAKRSQLTRTLGELERERGQEAEGKIVEEIIEHWRMATGHHGAKVSQVGERAQYVRKALHFGYSVDELKAVCDVAGHFPYVDPKRSKHPSGRCQTGETLRDDIPTLFKSEKTIDRLLDLAALPSESASNGSEDEVPTAERWRRLNYPLAIVLAALWDHCENIDAEDPDLMTATCPVHGGDGLVILRSDAGLISVRCERGCEFWRLLAALELEPGDLFENAEHDPTRRNADAQRTVPEHLKETAGLLQARLSGVAGSNGKV